MIDPYLYLSSVVTRYCRWIEAREIQIFLAGNWLIKARDSNFDLISTSGAAEIYAVQQYQERPRSTDAEQQYQERPRSTDAEQQDQERPRSTDAEQQYQESPRSTDAEQQD